MRGTQMKTWIMVNRIQNLVTVKRIVNGDYYLIMEIPIKRVHKGQYVKITVARAPFP